MTAAPNRNGPGAETPGPVIEADVADIEAFCSSDIGVKAAETQAGNDAGSHFLRAVRSSHEEMDMRELLERLGSATAQQLADDDWLAETRLAIANTFYSATSIRLDERRWWFDSFAGWQTINMAPDWLGSDGAALDLIDRLTDDWCLDTVADHRWLRDGSGYQVKLRNPRKRAFASGHADTLRLAICIAALRAKSGEGA